MIGSSVAIGDIATQLRGVTFAKEDSIASPADGYLAVLTASNVTETGISLSPLQYIPERMVKSDQHLRKNDIVVTASSGSLHVVGRAARVVERIDATFGAFCKVLRAGEKIDPTYLGHFLRTPGYRAKASRVAAGANINNLRNEDLNGIRIPLPPLPEQRRIAAILDQVEILRSERQFALQLSHELKDSAFVHLCEQSGISRSLGELGVSFVSGKSVTAASGAIHPRNRVLKTTSVTGGAFDQSESKPMPAHYLPPTSHQVSQGDLLFTRASGSIQMIGRTARVFEIPIDVYLPDKLWRVHLSANSPLKSLTVEAFFRQLRFRAHVMNEASGASGVLNISQEKVLSYAVQVPSIKAQEEFSRLDGNARALDAMSTGHLAKLNELFASLQHRAFNGEL